VKARRLEIGEYRGMIAADFDDPLFLRAFDPPGDLWSRPGIEILHDARNRVGRMRFAPSSSGAARDIMVKEFSTRGVNKLKSLFLPSKAAKAWKGAMALVERDLGTARPVAYLLRKRRGFVERSFFLSERIDEAVEVRGLFRDLPAPELENLLSSLADFLSVSQAKGIWHRDLSDGNILVKKDAAGNFRFYLLDTNRVRLRRRVGRWRGVKSLIRLGIPASHREFFLRRYFGGPPPGKYRLWYKISKTVSSSYVELKKKLRLRQLARKLRIQ
jgi:hypothetical protein